MLQNYQSLTVRQEVEMLQVFTGFETRNRYRVLDPNGQDVLYAYEESGTLSRLFLQSHRPLTLHIIDGRRPPRTHSPTRLLLVLSLIFTSSRKAGRWAACSDGLSSSTVGST